MNQRPSELTGNICVSIIIPIYNAKAFLAECLTSVQKQTFRDWECICVDDGSSDESPSIVEKFAEKDTRFRLIRQKNTGPGGARNTALKGARGEYFAFVDADDLVHPEMLKRLLDLAKTHRADLVVCDYFRFESDGEFRISVQNSELLSGKAEVYNAPLLPEMVNWKKFRVHPVGKLYQRARHGELRFPNLYGAEDAYASFDVYCRSNCAVFSQMRLYGYRIVEDGLTRSALKYHNYIIGDAQVAMHCEATCRKYSVSNFISAQLIMPYVMRIFFFLNEMSMDTRLSNREKKNLMTLAHKGLQNIKRCVAGKYKIVPLVHYVPYSAVRLRALWVLILWQWVRIHILKKGIRLLGLCSASNKFGQLYLPKL